MDPNEMLETVQTIKGNMVEALISGADEERVDEYAADFFRENTAQILDILDDALTAHLEGKW